MKFYIFTHWILVFSPKTLHHEKKSRIAKPNLQSQTLIVEGCVFVNHHHFCKELTPSLFARTFSLDASTSASIIGEPSYWCHQYWFPSVIKLVFHIAVFVYVTIGVIICFPLSCIVQVCLSYFNVSIHSGSIWAPALKVLQPLQIQVGLPCCVHTMARRISPEKESVIQGCCKILEAVVQDVMIGICLINDFFNVMIPLEVGELEGPGRSPCFARKWPRWRQCWTQCLWRLSLQQTQPNSTESRAQVTVSTS